MGFFRHLDHRRFFLHRTRRLGRAAAAAVRSLRLGRGTASITKNDENALATTRSTCPVAGFQKLVPLGRVLLGGARVIKGCPVSAHASPQLRTHRHSRPRRRRRRVQRCPRHLKSNSLLHCWPVSSCQLRDTLHLTEQNRSGHGCLVWKQPSAAQAWC